VDGVKRLSQSEIDELSPITNLAALKTRLAEAEGLLNELITEPYYKPGWVPRALRIRTFLAHAPSEYVAVRREWIEGMAQGKCYCSSPLHATCNHCRAKAALAQPPQSRP
jgi:hypothetical protein